MKPFSSRYFLYSNKAKVFSIILMTSMIALAYVGGLYLTNISEEAKAVVVSTKDFVRVNSSMEDTDHNQLEAFIHKLRSDKEIEVLQTGVNSYFYKTMLGFRNGDRAYSFTKNDFIKFNEKMNLISSDVSVSNNALLLSNKEAAHLKVEDGDQFVAFENEDIQSYYGDSPFKVIVFNRNAFLAYFVIDDVSTSNLYLLTWKKGVDKDIFFHRIEEFKKEYTNLEIITYKDDLSILNKNFEINNVIYYSIIGIISFVFAITINAVLVGLYDKRRLEFAIYQGIGIPVVKIYRKVACEILIMNSLGILLGGLFSILTVSLLNEYVYLKDGIRMWYFHKAAFLSVILCDLAILIPAIGLRIRKISKDVRQPEYL